MQKQQQEDKKKLEQEIKTLRLEHEQKMAANLKAQKVMLETETHLLVQK